MHVVLAVAWWITHSCGPVNAAGVNWMKHLKRVGVDYYLVGATDAKTAEFLAGQVGACNRG
jgi:hypothetical protein